MATTRIMPLHIGKGRTESQAISDIIDYVANPQKTDNGKLITGYGCDSRTADAEFLLAKRQYIAATGRVRGADDVIAYHVRQSFKPGEITPEEANRLGVEFAKRFTKGNHAFVVCTHIDKSHVHNHIIWSAVNADCDRKFRNFWGSTRAVRRLSDTICIENGLSIVEDPKPHGKSYNKWLGEQAKRCVLYPRVSTEMQVDGYSLEGQKNMLTRFADREEMIVVDTYEDAGKSGKSIEGRPAFQKMLRDIEGGLDIDYILVYKLSRFGRNAADILNSLELVQSYGVNLICIEEGIDSSQTSGKLLISVLSAVAEIERENIIEQTMNGRREKARQGGWNGGFAPYGYTLEDNKLMIEETEAVAIRKIFELYTSSEIGLGGIANQLNLQGIRKIPRQNGTLEDWTGHFIKLILDNPVYCGKIAYGRRTKEKVKGTKNDYQMKRNDDYILTEGQHKGIVSEEVWEKAHAKRLRTGVKQPSKIGRDRVHLLSGLLKCPVCGSPMYTNKHAWTNKDGTYKEIYYYVCSRNRMVRGKHCEYKAMLKKTDIEPMVIEAIREIVRNEEYAQAIKKRIGVQIDTKAVDKELEGYQAKLKEVDLNKTRLEREIDSLPADAKYRERKLHDMTLRLDSLYDVIVELEEKIEDARLRRDAIKQQAITLENIYKIMVNFDCVYNIINDEEKRNVVTALIKEIEIYRNDESEYPLKRIGLNFPVFKDGGEVTELLWDKGNTVETVCLLVK